MHILSTILLAYVLYLILGGLLIFICWICSNKYRLVVAVVVIGLFVVHIQSRPVDPPMITRTPVYEEPEPTKPIYVTQVFRPAGNAGPRVEEYITLEKCRMLPGYRGVVYGICVADVTEHPYKQ